MEGDRGERKRYHHGDLPAALRAAALELVGERGVAGFTLAEAARRVGVTGAAPYRHYADRDALLAALAVEGYQLLADRLRSVPDGRHGDRTDPSSTARLAGMAEEYVWFAGQERARFQVLFGAGLDKRRHPQVAMAAEAAFGLVQAEVAAHLSLLAHPAQDCLARDLWALAHGYASLIEEEMDEAIEEEIDHKIDHELDRGSRALASAASAAHSAAARLLAGSLSQRGS